MITTGQVVTISAKTENQIQSFFCSLQKELYASHIMSDTIRCYALNRFEGVSSEKIIEERAKEGGDNFTFQAGWCIKTKFKCFIGYIVKQFPQALSSLMMAPGTQRTPSPSPPTQNTRSGCHSRCCRHRMKSHPRKTIFPREAERFRHLTTFLFNLHFPPNFTHFINKTRLLRFHLILLIFIVK